VIAREDPGAELVLRGDEERSEQDQERDEQVE